MTVIMPPYAFETDMQINHEEDSLKKIRRVRILQELDKDYFNKLEDELKLFQQALLKEKLHDEKYAEAFFQVVKKSLKDAKKDALEQFDNRADLTDIIKSPAISTIKRVTNFLHHLNNPTSEDVTAYRTNEVKKFADSVATTGLERLKNFGQALITIACTAAYMIGGAVLGGSICAGFCAIIGGLPGLGFGFVTGLLPGAFAGTVPGFQKGKRLSGQTNNRFLNHLFGQTDRIGKDLQDIAKKADELMINPPKCR